VRHLHRHPSLHAGQTGASRAINDENGWRAQRYGIHGSFVDEASRSAKPVRQILDETLDLVAEDGKALGCERELDLARWIVARGTSADQQLTLYTEAMGRGLSNRDALAGVVDWLSAETVGETMVRH
jgi:glutamate---cysteine ligase / carboxylate-amine ligase